MAEAARWSATLTARCPSKIAEAVEEIARRRYSKPAEYIRQAVRAALQSGGFDPAQIGRLPSNDSGRAF
jgi:Arc/MetJ-type ribon-helix-helix transcriptional regulator